MPTAKRIRLAVQHAATTLACPHARGGHGGNHRTFLKPLGTLAHIVGSSFSWGCGGFGIFDRIVHGNIIRGRAQVHHAEELLDDHNRGADHAGHLDQVKILGLGSNPSHVHDETKGVHGKLAVSEACAPPQSTRQRAMLAYDHVRTARSAN